MTFLETVKAAEALAASAAEHCWASHDALFGAAFVYVMRGTSSARPAADLYKDFDAEVSQLCQSLKGKMYTASSVFKMMRGVDEATQSEARRTGASLKRLGYTCVNHRLQRLWIL